MVLYHAKNAYTTEEDYNQENFYDIVSVIIDQLITYGPVESGFTVYSDFYNLRTNSNCKNIIYKTDENAEKTGGHAVVIVGYGVENNRYYWIAQNYAEDNLDDNSERKQINIYINEVSKDCKIKFTAN